VNRSLNRAVLVRSAVAVLIMGTLVAGLWLMPGGASTAAKKTYTEGDCEVVQNITVDSSKGSGYFGKQAQAAADAFKDASKEVKDKALKKALKNLGSFYVDLGKADNIADAAVLTAKGGKAYAKALKEYLKATVYCVSQITIPKVTAPVVTSPSASSSTSTSSASTTSTSTATSTSTSAPATTTTIAR
jgi:hypothetical protein